MRKFLGILILISFFVMAFPRFSSAQYSQQQVASQASSQGEVLGIKETLQTFTGFAKDPQGNIVKWIVGGADVDGNINDQGLIGSILFAIARLLGGDVVETKLGESVSLPPGAIAMPAGDWYLTGGLVGSTKEMAAATISTPPASGVYYVANLIDGIGGKTAYANPAGLDFNDSQPVFRLWKQFRSLAFGLFAIAFVIMGLMIMFRVKISPQSVLTVEQALPKIVTALLLVAFSYAIAGFMVDLMYLLISVVITFLNPLPGSSLFGIEPTPKAVIGFGSMIWAPIYALAAVAAANFSAGLGSIIGFVGYPVTVAVGAGVGLIIFIVLLVMILFWMIKLVFELAKSYVYIILYIIFAPLYIFMGVFPNSPIGFGSWFKNIFANILVFPAVVAVMMIGLSLSTASSALQGAEIWTPPLVGSPTYNIGVFEEIKQSGAGTSVIGFTMPALIAIAIFSFLPKVPGKIREWMGSIDFAAGFGAGGGLMASARLYATGTGFSLVKKGLASAADKAGIDAEDALSGPKKEDLQRKHGRLSRMKGWVETAHDAARGGKWST